MWSSGFTCCEDGIVPAAFLLSVVTPAVQGSGSGTVHSSAIGCHQGPARLQVREGTRWCLLHPNKTLLLLQNDLCVSLGQCLLKLMIQSAKIQHPTTGS